jgi:Pyruvate/2-oxoacid:ferredoxin oxidoreductase delta subunit
MDTMHDHNRFCVDPTHGFRIRSRNTNFESNFVSNLTFDPYWPLTPTSRGQFLEHFKNAPPSLFVGSSRLVGPIFVHIGLAWSERQAKTWFRGEIRSNFDLWPRRTRSKLRILKKRHFGLVLRVKLLHCANFCPHQTCLIQTTTKNVISGEIRSNLYIWPCHTRSNLRILKKRRYGLILKVKLLHCAKFCPHQTCRIWMRSQNVISRSNFVKIWPLTSTCGVKFFEMSKTPLHTRL